MPWWLWSISEGGKLGVFSPSYATEGEASAYGFEKLGSNFEITELTTRDRAVATRAIKRIIFDRTSNLDKALERARHKLPDEGVQK
jgi:hypothetical protein